MIMLKFIKDKREQIGRILKFIVSLITLIITTFFVQSCLTLNS